jgi:hypothetical protein
MSAPADSMNLDTSPGATVIAMSKKVKNNEANEKHERGSDELLAVAERLRRYW